MAKPFDDDDFDMFGGIDDDDDFGFGGGPVNNGSQRRMSNMGMRSTSMNNDDSDDFGFGGNNFDDDESGFDTDDSFEDAPIQNSVQNSNIAEKMEAAKVKDLKKTAIMSVGIGIAVLLFAFVGIRVVKRVKNSPKFTVTQTSTYENNNVGNSVASQKVENSISNNLSSSASAWQEVNLSGVDLGDTWIESNFTITELKHYAMVTSSQNDKQVKSIAKGNISGLVGTYEMEIPTYMALKLSVGNSFKIKYQLKEQNGYKLIGDIQY